MKNLPLVSVVLITYNHEKYIAEAIESILSQTFNDLELVIVNDGSTDRTDDVIKKFKDDRILYIYQKNQGPSIALNNAILNARGRYIAQMSGDDVCYPNRLKRQLESFKDNQNLVIFSHCNVIGENSRELDENHFAENYFNRPDRTREEALNYLFYKGNYFNAPSSFAERKTLLDSGLYNPLYLQLQDYDLWIRLLIKGCKFHIIQEKLLKYRIRENRANLSADRPDVIIRTFFELSHILKNYLKINSSNDLLKIFPDSVEYAGLDKELIPFAIAMLSLNKATFTQAHNVFALNVLYDLMDNKELRGKIIEKFNFNCTDFFKLIAECDTFNYKKEKDAELLWQKLAEKDQQIAEKNRQLAEQCAEQNRQIAEKDNQLIERNQFTQSLLNSYSWKITAPLRAIIKSIK